MHILPHNTCINNISIFVAYCILCKLQHLHSIISTLIFITVTQYPILYKDISFCYLSCFLSLCSLAVLTFAGILAQCYARSLPNVNDEVRSVANSAVTEMLYNLLLTLDINVDDV